MTPTKTTRHNRSHKHSRCYRLELDFRRAVQHVPNRHVSYPAELQFAVRRYCPVSGRHDTRHHARTFHQLDPTTGHWKRL